MRVVIPVINPQGELILLHVPTGETMPVIAVGEADVFQENRMYHIPATFIIINR